MKRPYSPAFVPPAPVVPVTVGVPGADARTTIDGKLDTGADLCAIPDRLVGELGLPISRTVRAAGFAGELREAVVYRVDIAIDGVDHPRVEALSTRRPYVIVGRNVLNDWVAKLDGPALRVGLARPTRRPRR